jgi:hypothetical protein
VEFNNWVTMTGTPDALNINLMGNPNGVSGWQCVVGDGIASLSPASDSSFTGLGQRCDLLSVNSQQIWSIEPLEFSTHPETIGVTNIPVTPGKSYIVRVRVKIASPMVGFGLERLCLQAVLQNTEDPTTTVISSAFDPMNAVDHAVGDVVDLLTLITVPIGTDSLYPAADLYPSETLFPEVTPEYVMHPRLFISSPAGSTGVFISGHWQVAELVPGLGLPQYGDGDTTNWQWDGTPNASSSRQYHTLWNDNVIQITSVTGMIPEVRKAVTNRPQRHGVIVGRGRMGSMQPQISGQFVHTGPQQQESMRSYLLRCLMSLYDEWGTFEWKPSNSSTWRSVEVQVIEKPDVSGDLIKTFQFMLVTSQPFIRGQAMNSAYTTFLSDQLGGGLTFPFEFPINFVDPGGSGFGSFVNAGENISYPTLTLYGPLTNPVIRNRTTGQELKLIGESDDFVLGADETLVIDTWEETIYLNGDVTKPVMQYLDTVTSTFWAMDPGPNSIGITGTAPDPAKTRLKVEWWDSYV